MTYSIIPGHSIVLDGLTPANDRTVFTKLPNGKIQMDLTTHSNQGGFRGMGVRLGSDVEQSITIQKSQARELLKFLYREIHTVDELRELNTGSVIRYWSEETKRNLTFESWKPSWSDENNWEQTGVGGSVPASSMEHFLPATLIFEAD